MRVVLPLPLVPATTRVRRSRSGWPRSASRSSMRCRPGPDAEAVEGEQPARGLVGRCEGRWQIRADARFARVGSLTSRPASCRRSAMAALPPRRAGAPRHRARRRTSAGPDARVAFSCLRSTDRGPSARARAGTRTTGSPAGRSPPMVCLMTRGPAKPISAPGSAMLMSPSVAKLAVTPPVVGLVSTEMNGMPASRSRASAAAVLAICISESSDSCMRAPPQRREDDGRLAAQRSAVQQRAGDLLTHHRAHAAAHERELESASPTGRLPIAPAPGDHGVFLAGLLHARLDAVAIAFVVLETQRIRARDAAVGLLPGVGVDQAARCSCSVVQRQVVAAGAADPEIAVQLATVQDLRAPVGIFATGCRGPRVCFARAWIPRAARFSQDTRQTSSARRGRSRGRSVTPPM